ncbi:MAG: hypothetical protein WCG26_14795 [Chloroflexales bacterium]
MRPNDVARLAGVPVAQVVEVTATEVRRALADRVSEAVLDVATQEPTTYWLAGGHYWLDDPAFGPVVAFTHLDYDADLGLHIRRGGA